jgi:hypothetical protein
MEDSHIILGDVGGKLGDISLFAVCMSRSKPCVFDDFV